MATAIFTPILASETNTKKSSSLSQVGAAALNLARRAIEMHERIDNNSSLYAKTLMDFAVRDLERLAASDGDESELVYSTEALLAGSLAQDEKECPSESDRHALVGSAAELMAAASLSIGAYAEPGDDLALGVRVGKAVTTPGRTALSAQQFEIVIEEVASRTRNLQQLLMLAQTEDDAHQRAVCLDAAVSIATSIGAMADGASGGSVIGDADHWNFGPNFADYGKMVQV